MDPVLRLRRALRLAAPAVLGAVFVASVLTSSTTPALALCPAVTDIDASDGVYCGYVRVRWNRDLLGTGWRVYRSLDAAGTVNMTLLATVTSAGYSDMTAVPGVTYYYWVQNYGGTCSSISPRGGPDAGWSGTLTAPTGVSATDAQLCGKVRVTWNAVAGAASYDVFRSADSNVANAALIGDTTATTYDDGTVADRVPYYYWVRARSAANCDGELPVLGKLGRSDLPALPDLVLNPSDAGASVGTDAFGRKVLEFATSMRNSGNAALIISPKKFWWDGTSDIYQKALDCQGRTTTRFLGRFRDDEDHPLIPHFVRARLRKRVLPGGGPGEVVAQLDVQARCLEDDYEWNPALPGHPATPQFGICAFEQGISVGWMAYQGPGHPGHQLDLSCVPPDTYWFELIIDPDDQIRELDESNNVVSQVLTLTSLPPVPDPTVCTGPQVVGTLLSPDSMIAIDGMPSDSITARVWIAGLTEAPGHNPLTVAQIGYRPHGVFNIVESVDPPGTWTWLPATWLRQDGAEDVYGGALTIPQPGEYDVGYRFSVFDGPWIYADRGGSLDGFQTNQMTRLHVVSTTGVDDPPSSPVALAFEALTDPARGATRFRVSLPSASTLRLSIYDVRGRLVRSLERATRDAGVHLVEWDGRNDAGRGAPRGLYVARLETSAGARLTAKFFSLAR